MRLFDEEQYEGFFSPLTSRNRILHYNCTKELIKLTLNTPSELYEEDAKNELARYIKNSSFEFSDEEGEEFKYSEDRTVIGQAASEIKYLRSKGWLAERELARNGEPLANITYDCMRLMRFLEDTFNSSNSGTLANLLMTIHAILKEITEINPRWVSPRRDKPYALGIVPLYDAVYKLKEEMTSLRVRIRQMKGDLLNIDRLASVNDYILSDPTYAKMIKEYNYVTKGGYFPQIVGQILEMMEVFLEDGDLKETTVLEYMESENCEDVQIAMDALESKYAFIRNYFDYAGYYDDVDAINRKMDEYFDLLGTRIRVITSGERNIAADLDKMLIAIADMEDAKKQEIYRHALDGVLVYSNHLFVSPRSVKGKRENRKATKQSTQPVYTPAQAKEDVERYKKNLEEKLNGKYGDKKIISFLSQITRGEDIVIKEEEIKDSENALKMLAAFIRSGRSDFPFEVEIQDGELDNGKLSMSKMIIRRKKDDNATS